MSLPGLYDRLDPKERLRLALAARFRGDSGETRRLVESCPMKHYRITDPVFMDPWHRCLDLGVFFAFLWTFYFWRFVFLDLIEGLFEDPLGTQTVISEKLGCRVRRKTPDAQRTGKVPDEVREAWANALEKVITLHRGFARFCREIAEVEPELLLKPLATEMDLLRPVLESKDLPVSEEKEAEFFDLFRQFWRPGT